MSTTNTSPTPLSPSTSQARAPYADAVRAFGARDWQRLNVPGHAAVPGDFPDLAALLGDALQLDLPPLLDGVDLGDASPLDEALRLAADAWGAHRTWFLTNGASQGNRIVTLALASLGTKVAVQRSVHSSVIDGLVLSGLSAVFVQPSIDTELGIAHGVTARSVARALDEHPDVAAVYVVTPSYFGAVADVPEIAATAHAHGVPLIVDEAWGAHFGFHPELPGNALRHGADLVVSSTHKLGGSLTQSAMLHLGSGRFAEQLEPLLDRAFRLTQSTSASSLLLSSLDLARRALVNGTQGIEASLRAADRIRAGVRAEGRYRIVSDGFRRFADIAQADPLRVAVDTLAGGISGHQARWHLMRDHGILVEVATQGAVVAVVGAGSVPDPTRFLEALHALPRTETPAPNEGARPFLLLPEPGPVRMAPRQAFLAPSEVLPADAAVGRVSADTLAAYPPGIPNVLPGEVITADLVDFFRRTVAVPHGHVRGALDPAVSMLRIVAEPTPA
ncbi:arginine decarboxylase [Streptacidiphilus sp. MAP12-33]|uniref:aminotransferase class I/II-fold pyridoxal phosphate-dependent enzyme n=1 Tax=Streptacidiphilus sp. MAP12-33 TaxID=3156266 RepID=UPI003517C812